ncbi:unnamed protein product [Acanthocheilonema viteae]|uniref:BTB domain-containing protein n=1 Tax=Acanthocheilonema viteae TaxID=6277 RepID=A0A498SCN3_ACAVI|nr:unnamed protein product [Acanthocheilonema viteae]
MANFIKKIVDRARSRSKSPVKYQRNDCELWKQMKQQQKQQQQQQQQQSSHYGSPIRTIDHFIHPKYEPQLHIHKDYGWDAHQIDDINPHSTTSHQSDIIHSNKELFVPKRSKSPTHVHNDTMDDSKHNNEPSNSLSNPTNHWAHHSDASIINVKQKGFNSKKKHISRPRSSSPTKASQTSFDEITKKSRSKSPTKKFSQISETLDYLSAQCQLGGCSATIIVQDTKFLVCKHQLSHISDYFRALFLDNKTTTISGVYHNSCNEFAVVVSSLKYPPPAVQFKWFLESVIQTPVFSDITDDTLETCMRLSKRFRAKCLEMKCAQYIQDNVTKRTPMVALCWLNWVLKHKFDQTTYDACLPCVAAASVRCLEEHRNLISERLLADLLAAKLRTLYDQAVNVFQTIHSMDHFYVDVAKCPNCGREREQGKIRVQASPCSLSGKDHKDLQACYQCEHGLITLNDQTADCHCQIPLLALHLRDSHSHFLSLASHH